MSERRVVVTGLGAISALGHSVDEIWSAVRDGTSGIARHMIGDENFGPPPQSFAAARVRPGYESAISEWNARACLGLDAFASLLLCAAFEGVQSANLLGAPALESRTAIVSGHGMGGIEALEKAYQRYYGQRQARLHPTTIPRVMMSAGASAVAMAMTIRGPVFVTSSACASSAHAIAQGAAMIKAGMVDVAVVGGSEAIITAGCMSAWDAIHAMSSTTCRPFSKDRDGMVIGEGAGVLVLEELDHARTREAPVWAEFVGAGLTSDAFHITQPSLEGPLKAMETACASADVRNADSILISAHGTGTPLNDANEAAAINALFGSKAVNHPVIATKSAHGHLIGGSAALQAVIALRALRDRVAPPILNHTAHDPACNLDLVLGEQRRLRAQHLLVNAFAFGGLNASLAFASADLVPHA